MQYLTPVLGGSQVIKWWTILIRELENKHNVCLLVMTLPIVRMHLTDRYFVMACMKVSRGN